jgi:hypothetical protein
MDFVAGGVAFEFLHPPDAAVRGCRAIPAPAMPMPEAAVDEDGDFVFRKDNVGTNDHGGDAALRRPDSAARCPYLWRGDWNPCVQPEGVAEAMEQ